jgi:hypothetical protein
MSKDAQVATKLQAKMMPRLPLVTLTVKVVQTKADRNVTQKVAWAVVRINSAFRLRCIF